MNKKVWITILLLIIVGIGGFFLLKNSNNLINQKKEEISSKNNTNSENSTEYTSEKTSATNETDKNAETTTPKEKKQSETQISEFSTKIYTKDHSRQNNIQITCSTLNNTDVAPGNTFSFTNTVGRATSNKGYQEADIFQNGKKKKGLGGGNCQISTTLYNAVLKVNQLKVTERHEHSNDVPYITKGKDAAVSYGAYDLKFVNNLNHTVRIKASATKNNVTIKLMQLN